MILQSRIPLSLFNLARLFNNSWLALSSIRVHTFTRVHRDTLDQHTLSNGHSHSESIVLMHNVGCVHCEICCVTETPKRDWAGATFMLQLAA